MRKKVIIACIPPLNNSPVHVSLAIKKANKTNTQSTYLYDILNGFGNAGEIMWVTKPLPFYNNQKPNPKERKGVYKGDKWTASKYEEPRKRKWGYDRKNLSKSDII